MARIPQQYRAALQTWVANNIHKAVHTHVYTEGVFTLEDTVAPEGTIVPIRVPVMVDFQPPDILVYGDPPEDPETPRPPPTVVTPDIIQVQQTTEHSIDYLDTHELALRLGKKIRKAAPELRGKFDLGDLEELLDDKLPQLLALAGVTTTGSGGRRYNDFKDEDPDA